MKSLMKTVPERILEQQYQKYIASGNPQDWIEYCNSIAILTPDIATDRLMASIRDSQTAMVKSMEALYARR